MAASGHEGRREAWVPSPRLRVPGDGEPWGEGQVTETVMGVWVSEDRGCRQGPIWAAYRQQERDVSFTQDRGRGVGDGAGLWMWGQELGFPSDLPGRGQRAWSRVGLSRE